jgi:hypothetical protein
VKPEKRDIDECSRIFVSWVYMVAIIAGAAATIGTLAWAGSERFTKMDNSINSLSSDVDHLKVMDTKLDTLLMRTRHE